MDCLFGFCYTFLYTEITKVIINILFKKNIYIHVYCVFSVTRSGHSYPGYEPYGSFDLIRDLVFTNMRRNVDIDFPVYTMHISF